MCAQLYSTQLRETMADWDQSDVFSLAPSMYPPEFMWAGEDDSYDLKEEKAVIRKHYNRSVCLLDDGSGYGTLKSMGERLDNHHSRAEKAAARYESRRNYARLQHAVMEEKVISIAREREDSEDEEAIVEKANQVLDEPMGAHCKMTVFTKETEPVWYVTASTYHPDESTSGEPPLSSKTIRLRPENGDWATKFEEDHLRYTDRRRFDGDKTWRAALESIEKRRKQLEELCDRARRTKERLRFRKAVIETVLYRFDVYGSVEEMTESEAGDIARERRGDDSERMMDWEINAAQLYAYVQEYDQPSSMEELHEETKVSPRQAWDKLKEQGYGIGEGVTGLVSALEEWAPEFEEEYGKEKARKAARKGLFNWPDQHEA